MAGYDCPEIYGDPAILMPLIYQPQSTNKKYPVSVIHHISQKDEKREENINYIDVATTDYKKVIDEIVKSEKIISSSLHGIILAETYGVPAVFLKSGMEDQIMKFLDWYYATGRYNVVTADSIDEAMRKVPMQLPELEACRENLMEAFPSDLWNLSFKI